MSEFGRGSARRQLENFHRGQSGGRIFPVHVFFEEGFQFGVVANAAGFIAEAMAFVIFHDNFLGLAVLLQLGL